jgi:hypothetical protein
VPHHILDMRPPSPWHTLRCKDLSAAASTIVLGHLPAGYDEWRLVVRARSTAAAEGDAFTLTFNGDSGANYDLFRYDQAGVSRLLAQNSLDLGLAEGANARAACQGWSDIILLQPASAAVEKAGCWQSGRMGDRSAAGDLLYRDGMWGWRSTAAIHTITLAMTAGDFAAGSRAVLWGLTAA